MRTPTTLRSCGGRRGGRSRVIFFGLRVPDGFIRQPRIAYFSIEIALRDEIPTYSGGLGGLAGDTMTKDLEHSEGCGFPYARETGADDAPVHVLHRPARQAARYRGREAREATALADSTTREVLLSPIFAGATMTLSSVSVGSPKRCDSTATGCEIDATRRHKSLVCGSAQTKRKFACRFSLTASNLPSQTKLIS